MILNIITRTSGRPRYFKQCKESVRSIKGEVNHLVTWDNEEDLEYLNKYDDITLIDVREVKGKGNCPWNKYLNKALEEIEGWVLVLDDDDVIKDPDIISYISPKLSKETFVAFWKVAFPGIYLPDKDHWKRKPRAGQISMIGMCFNTIWRAKWGDLFDCKCMGDCRLAGRFWEDETCDIKWVPQILTGINRSQTGGHGRKDDLES